MKSLIIIKLLIVMLIGYSQANLAGNFTDIDRKTLVVYMGEGEQPLLRTNIGKKVVNSLLEASSVKSTTSCRLENKRIVSAGDLKRVLEDLVCKGYDLEDREVKNIPDGAKAGTFTFYGTALKFIESPHLPKTSIKMRIRMYITEKDGVTKRSVGTDHSGFLEIKIKNPVSNYPLSVHKYRIMLPDQDILELIRSKPDEQKSFSVLIDNLRDRALNRDIEAKNTQLIETMFEQIKIMAIAEPKFIKPIMGITYHRVSKKYDEEYILKIKKKKRFRSNFELVKKTRSYEITIDNNLKAFRPDFSTDLQAIDLDKYFLNETTHQYLIAAYPADLMVVEFKQPDNIGYDGPGKIRTLDSMKGAQKILWQAFVGELGEKAAPNTKPDSGKFFHVKQFMRIQDGQAKKDEKTVLMAPKNL